MLFIFVTSFAIVLVTNFGFIMFIFLVLFLAPLSLFKNKKLFEIFESFSFWMTLKGKLILCSGIDVIILFSWGFWTRKELFSGDFFGKVYGCSKMCTTETNNLINLQKKLGYVNKCSIDELKRLVNKYKNTFVDNIKAFSGDLYPIINDALNVWSNMASSIEDKHK